MSLASKLSTLFFFSEFLSASYVDTSEDSDSEDDAHQKQPVRSRDNGGTGATVVNGSQDVAMTPCDVGVVSQDVGVVSPDGGAAQYVSHLRATGYVEELQWLEAYLLDEARDRTVDGEIIIITNKWRINGEQVFFIPNYFFY